MLFSEPKIPHSMMSVTLLYDIGFSALQRAENSSSGITMQNQSWSAFQCSSASRKFLSVRNEQRRRNVVWRFSALQRAENSSSSRRPAATQKPRRFSALQRAENSSAFGEAAGVTHSAGFSALQRAENSSSKDDALKLLTERFQCSSASRKFLNNLS